MNALFIYAKDGKILVKDLDQSHYCHKAMLKDGWKHTATINPAIFIQNLHNQCNYEEMVKQITDLGKTYEDRRP